MFLTVLSTTPVYAQQTTTEQTQTDEKKATEANSISKANQARQYMELVNSVFNFLLENYVDEIDPEVLYQGTMKGLMDSIGDPYTVYLDKSDMLSLSDTTVGSFGGVGLSISKANESTPTKPAYVEVTQPIEDGPGWKAGIQSGDMIISINGVSTVEITMDEVLAMLRGEIGTTVDLVIKRGKNMEIPFTLERELIVVSTVKYSMIDNTGYLRITEFNPYTPEKVQDAFNFFKEKNYTSLILDLRDNPGGTIASAVDVADKFIDEGPIVSTKSRLTFENSVYLASEKATVIPKGLPIIVLINAGSASASEILSGALKDNHIAYLIGEKTYGKGSVQQPVPLRYSDGIKLTIARYYSPSDTNIDKIGIPPDREVLFPSLTEEEEKAYVALITDDVISPYVEDHQDMTENDISDYAKKLQQTYNLELRLLRRIIRLEVYRTRTPLVYDLDFDIQLQEAIKIVTQENLSELLKNTKSLHELQEEAQAKQVSEVASVSE